MRVDVHEAEQQRQQQQQQTPEFISRRPRLQRMTELPTRSVRRMPSDLFLWAAGASLALSAGLRFAGRRDDAIFVGEWVPTMLLLGVLTRL